MDESESTQDQYASFLVRLWHTAELESGSSSGALQGEVEHIQSGRRLAFASIGELWEFLCQPLAAGIGLGESV